LKSVFRKPLPLTNTNLANRNELSKRNQLPISGTFPKEYLRYDDDRLPKHLLQNLLSKYQSIYGTPFFDPDPEFNIEFNQAYIDRKRQQGRTIEKLITIAAGTERETRVKAIECPFRLTTHPDLIRVGYECGFGENNSMGFGMVKAE
jgi:CRISPR-associated endoribonuclease Cas6